MSGIHDLLRKLRGHYNQRDLAAALGVTARTMRRWEAGDTEPPPFLADAIRQRLLPLMESEAAPGKRAFSRTGNWSREQTMLAFHFYCQTPFGQLHSRNKKVVELANLIGRTPSALAMKCVNLASLDPAIRNSGRSGLSNASALDQQIWDEFHANGEALVEKCNALLAHLRHETATSRLQPAEDQLVDIDFNGETRVALVKLRKRQEFFRHSVLSSYGERCCISGVSDKRLLVASHIVAWKDDPTIRLHPGNGLCLSAIHDKAFDNHLFSLTDDRRIILSDQLRRTNDMFLQQVFLPIEGNQISLPEKFAPEVKFIERHRKIMFRDS